MSYVPPNTFVTATPFNGGEWQENSDELRDYIDGGMSAADISTARWVRAPHIMRGTYIPLNNTHEFTSGVVRGGFFQNTNCQIGADSYRSPLPNFQFIEGQCFWSIDFTPQATNAKIRLSWQLHPKHPPARFSNIGGQGARNNFASLCIHPNFAQVAGTATTSVTSVECQEHAAGNFRDSQNLGPGLYNFTEGIPGQYRRRVQSNFIYDTFSGMTPGQTYSYRLYIGTGVVLNDFAELNYSLELYYV
jgi:hypothetical protein